MSFYVTLRYVGCYVGVKVWDGGIAASHCLLQRDKQRNMWSAAYVQTYVLGQ
jgi:hypothetical protein